MNRREECLTQEEGTEYDERRKTLKSIFAKENLRTYEKPRETISGLQSVSESVPCEPSAGKTGILRHGRRSVCCQSSDAFMGRTLHFRAERIRYGLFHRMFFALLFLPES